MDVDPISNKASSNQRHSEAQPTTEDQASNPSTKEFSEGIWSNLRWKKGNAQRLLVSQMGLEAYGYLNEHERENQ